MIDVRNDPPMTCHGADSPWVVKAVAVTWAAQVALEAPGWSGQLQLLTDGYMPNERNSRGPPQSCHQLARHLDLLARVCPQNLQLICTILGLNRSCRILVNRRRRNPLDRACVHQLARNVPTPSRASFCRMDPFESHQIRRMCWSIRREIMYYVPTVN